MIVIGCRVLNLTDRDILMSVHLLRVEDSFDKIHILVEMKLIFYYPINPSELHGQKADTPHTQVSLFKV